jgi:hypothetical protein
MAEDFAARNRRCDPTGQGFEFHLTFSIALVFGMKDPRSRARPAALWS